MTSPFSAARGETVGVIGGTGSGKSTLVSLIPPLLRRVAGQRAARRADVRSYTRASLCDKVGVVQQKAVLFQGQHKGKTSNGAMKTQMTPRCEEALTAAQAKEVVEGKPGGLDFELEQNGRNLSGGQKQRLSIARALVKKPEILILDDSSSALDLPPTPRCAGRYTASQAA